MALVRPNAPSRLQPVETETDLGADLGPELGTDRRAEPRADLASADPDERRRAVRALAETEEGLSRLLAHLSEEPALRVRSALFNALIDHRSPAVAEGLAQLLGHEDAGLRNGAIEALQTMPEEADQALEASLASADADLRLFAVNVLSLTTGETAAGRLVAVLDTDDHINVCAAAIEGLTEIGDERALPALARARARFFDSDFMRFAIDLAVQRIEGR